MGKMVCGMQEHEFTVSQLLCTNSHGCWWRGLYIPTPLSERGPLRGQQYRQTLRRTGKRNAPSWSGGLARMAGQSRRTRCSLPAWSSLLVLGSHCVGWGLCCHPEDAGFPLPVPYAGTAQPAACREGDLVSGWKRRWFRPVLTKWNVFVVKSTCTANCNYGAVRLIVEPV